MNNIQDYKTAIWTIHDRKVESLQEGEIKFEIENNRRMLNNCVNI